MESICGSIKTILQQEKDGLVPLKKGWQSR